MGGGWGGFFPLGAGQGFGLLMLPFGVGVALLIGDVNRRIGWFLIWASSAALAVGVLQSLVFNFRTTSLFSLLAMICMIGGGGALMFRSLKDDDADEKAKLHTDIDQANLRVKDLTEEVENLRAKTDKKP